MLIGKTYLRHFVCEPRLTKIKMFESVGKNSGVENPGVKNPGVKKLESEKSWG